MQLHSLVDKHQSGGVKHALLAHPTTTGASHVCALSFGRLQAYGMARPSSALET
jgi:hypothetical protein